jgi:hypothetical protein
MNKPLFTDTLEASLENAKEGDEVRPNFDIIVTIPAFMTGTLAMGKKYKSIGCCKRRPGY